MTIKIYGDKIEIGEYTIQETPTGFSIDGYFDANLYVTSATTAYNTGGVPNQAPILTFPMATPFATSTTHGALTQGKEYLTGQSSTSSGYVTGGRTFPPSLVLSGIESFPFATSPASTTSVGSISQARFAAAGVSSITDGYTLGGTIPPFTNTIDKFPFSTPFTTATDIGDLSAVKGYVSPQVSTTDGYSSGGYGPPFISTIENFPFSTPFTTATSVGSLTLARLSGAGQSSSSTGYTSGGKSPSLTVRNTIDSFPFSTPFTTATDIGDLFASRGDTTGHFSDSEAFTAGGYSTNTIDKFPFSTPFATATDAGDLSSTSRNNAAGHQG